MTESGLERKVCSLVKQRDGRAFKFISPGCTGVPDRICIFPGGRIIFIELKRPGRKDGLSPQQRRVITWLKKHGCTVWVINDFEYFRRLLDGLPAV